jgi:capsular polysaccharide biosynthesis protein
VEISDYLRIIWRRLWILILVPLLAGIVVAALVLRQPPKYDATATVAAPAVVGGQSTNQYSGSTGPRAFVANFTATLTSPRIINQVAKETSVLPRTIRDGLVAAPIGESSLIEVTYTTMNKDKAIPVAKSAVDNTIRFLFQTQVSLAEETVSEAKKAVDEANGSLQSFYRSTGLILPERTYELEQQKLSSLQQRELQERSAGNITAATAIAQAITTSETRLRRLAPRVATYQSLVDRRNQAQGRLNLVQQNLEAATAQYKAADPAEVVTLNQAKPVSRLAELLRKAVPAAGAGLFLAVGLVVLLEVVARRPRPDQLDDTMASEAPAASPTEPVPTGSAPYHTT